MVVEESTVEEWNDTSQMVIFRRIIEGRAHRFMLAGSYPSIL